MMEEILKIEADSKGVWISSESDNFTLAAVIHFLRMKGVRKYNEKAVIEFVRQKSRTPQKIADRNPSEERLSVVTVHLSKDNMAASVTVDAPFFTNPWPNEADILESLERVNVTFGVDKEAIEKLAELKVAEEHVVVATGKPPVNGHDARIELLIDPDQAPIVDYDAEITDHRERSPFVNVNEGDKIALKHPPTQGENGMSVTGTEVKAAVGRNTPFPAASGFKISEDGLLLTAAIYGRLLRKDGKLFILPELEIRGDVDYSVGNINFKGCVKITGTVRDGFQVIATNDIEIRQAMEGAVIESSTNVTIAGGVQGMGRGRITAAGDIFANFVNQTYINSGGNINIKNSVLHSDLTARESITVMGGRKAQIIGGRIQAGVSVVCDTLGSEIGTKTEVIVGILPELNKRHKELETSIAKCTDDLEKLEANIGFLQRRALTGTIDNDQRISIVTAMKSKYQFLAALKSQQDEKQDIESYIELSKSKGIVKVKNICYPGVSITIRGYSYLVREAFKGASFICDEKTRDIRMIPFDGVVDESENI